jgi:hypothetical protein
MAHQVRSRGGVQLGLALADGPALGRIGEFLGHDGIAHAPLDELVVGLARPMSCVALIRRHTLPKSGLCNGRLGST